MRRLLILLVLSLALPPLLRYLEAGISGLIAPWLEGTGLLAPDVALLLIAGCGLLVARCVGLKHLGFSPSDLRLDRYTPLLMLLAVVPSLVATRGITLTPDFAWVTTAVSEEIVSRGLWFAVLMACLRLAPDGVRSAACPVLLSSLFFLVWHVPGDLSWPGAGFVAVGAYKALTLGVLRAHSRSLYPCIAVHCVKLVL